jgi:hypothetical protein
VLISLSGKGGSVSLSHWTHLVLLWAKWAKEIFGTVKTVKALAATWSWMVVNEPKSGKSIDHLHDWY